MPPNFLEAAFHSSLMLLQSFEFYSAAAFTLLKSFGFYSAAVFTLLKSFGFYSVENCHLFPQCNVRQKDIYIAMCFKHGPTILQCGAI